MVGVEAALSGKTTAQGWTMMQVADEAATADVLPAREFLGMMLGVRRPSMTVVADALQRAGLITYKQAIVRILDRDGLEAAACECYSLIRKEFDALAF